MSEQAKRNAAAAVIPLLHNGMRLGIGTGSTAVHFVELLGEQVGQGLKVVGVPTSESTAALCREFAIPLTDLDETPRLNLAVDGADEVDPALNLIKGGGGALLREKIVASAAARFVVIADSRKRVDTLGAFPLPVEIVAMARRPVSEAIAAMGADVQLRQDGAGAPFLTDEGHWILDCAFGPTIADPPGLATRLSALPGVVEHGLFCAMADVAFIADDGSVTELRTEG